LNVDSRLANNKYVLYALNNPDHFERAAEMAHGVGRLRANLSDVKSFVVPLAPLSEQQRIVTKIEAMFAQADIIEQAASVSLRRAEQVDQSILARAFRGELG
jgi:type I restriction enzyme S subunit